MYKKKLSFNIMPKSKILSVNYHFLEHELNTEENANFLFSQSNESYNVFSKNNKRKIHTMDFLTKTHSGSKLTSNCLDGNGIIAHFFFTDNLTGYGNC